MMRFLNTYLKILIFIYALILFSRIFEYTSILIQHDPVHLFSYEITGLIGDLIIITLIFLILYLLYYGISLLSERFAYYLFLVLTLVFATIHIGILIYYFLELKLLDTFLFKYPFLEIYYTIKTCGTSGWSTFFPLAIPLIIVVPLHFVLRKVVFPKRLLKAFAVFMLLTIPLYFAYSHNLKRLPEKHYSYNKSLYFYRRSIFFFAHKKSESGKETAYLKYQKIHKDREYISQNYPFLHKLEIKDVLSNFISKTDTAPNFVFLVIEGMGDKFLHPIYGLTFAPFLDSLSKKSLYWDRFLTNGERSFAAVPCLLASLPHGEKGFTDLERMPYQLSLINILNASGYFSSFFIGQGSWFHHLNVYFSLNNAGQVFDYNNFSPKYHKIYVGGDNYFWGYNDKELFEQYFEVTDTLQQNKRIDVFFTGTSHTPYKIDNEVYYNKKLDQMLASIHDKKALSHFKRYRKYYLGILFVNDAIKDFFTEYKNKKSFRNTIFIITGDHPLTEIPISNPIQHYHVPLIIYSPLINKNTIFHCVNCQLNLYEPILSFLHNNYNISIPLYSSAIGLPIDTSRSFQNVNDIPFMNTNRDVVDYMSGNYFLDENILYQVDSDFNLTIIKDTAKYNELYTKRSNYIDVSYFASLQGDIIPDSVYFKYTGMNNLYNAIHEDTFTIRKDTYVTVPEVTVPNQPLYYDLSFDIINIPLLGRVTGIYQISDNENNIIEQKSFDISSIQKIQQYHFRIKKPDSQNSELKFKAFINNKDKARLELRNFKAYLYFQKE